VTLPVAVALLAARAPHPAAPEPAAQTDAVANDHRALAGAVRDGEYVLELEMRRTSWRPNASDGLSVDVPAFAEVGAPAMLPGPLVRVPAGTRMRITVRNALAQPATVHGLHDHRGPRDSVVLAPGETRTVRFDATVAGTFAYFARTNAAPTLFSRRDDSQLVGAFIVDRAGADPVRANARERILVMTAWDDSLRNPASPYGPRQVYAINGRSWPFTERLTYDEGDSVRWRVLNLSQHSHPMHLHGTYFRVQARGMPFADTAFGGAARLAVTESLGAGATMSIAWVAERPGNWLFHCHLINHIDEALRLGDAVVDPAHTDHARVTDMMAGLVSAITVRPASARPPRRSTIRRRLRLVVTERPAADRACPVACVRAAARRARARRRLHRAPRVHARSPPGRTHGDHGGEPGPCAHRRALARHGTREPLRWRRRVERQRRDGRADHRAGRLVRRADDSAPRRHLHLSHARRRARAAHRRALWRAHRPPARRTGRIGRAGDRPRGLDRGSTTRRRAAVDDQRALRSAADRTGSRPRASTAVHRHQCESRSGASGSSRAIGP
jgi:hypothetical protein